MSSQKSELPANESQPKNDQHKESLLLNMALNILIPTLILTKFSGEAHFGPKLGIIVALAFPIFYGLYDFTKQKKLNVFSALGIVSILLTGGISLLELDPKYIAIKEATIPAILGIVTIISIRTKHPIVKLFIYNDKVINTEKISQHLSDNGNQKDFDRAFITASYMVSASFFLSATLNYVLAKWLVVSQPGTEAFANELGKMTAYSYVVIMVPSMAVLLSAMIYLIRQITRLTGMTLEEILNDPKNA